MAGSRFAPGTLLGGRYRIVGLIGTGGMGEVYRAEDLLLGQSVALKFLPQRFADHPERLERLLAEVRIARQVSHPNVCRVYDVAEAEGHRFFSMELVEGEDLASLLKQVGRVPGERGLELARQLCAGLAAAHEQGVVHRDLKPANVIVDRAGRLHITDFGLALAGSARGGEAFAGTPAYMSPEQRAGREATVRSDIFSLGVVLYELFTGHHPFPGRSPGGPGLDTEGHPAPPSDRLREIDPAVERALLACLERDPEDRPASALAVAAELPGSDPLAAAMAAGETPSPETVAAAGGEGGLEPSRAALLLALGLVGLALAVWGSWYAGAERSLPQPRSPQFLAERAEEILGDLGHDLPVRDRASALWYDRDARRFLGEQPVATSRRWLAAGRLPLPAFFYRQSPEHLVAPVGTGGFSIVQRHQPPLHVPLEALVELDVRGRLLGLAVEAPARLDRSPGPTGASPEALFAAAGLDLRHFTPARAEWTAPVAVDERAAWTGSPPELPDVPLRLEAGARQGHWVWLRIIGPWTPPAFPPRAGAGGVPSLEELIGAVWFSLFLVGGVLLARRNLRLGRGDRRGASRLALWFFVACLLVWLLRADHVMVPSLEMGIVRRDLGYNLFFAALLWILYLGLEPYVRRHWPETLISWSRLLRAKWRDPRLGRDVLIGLVAAPLLRFCFLIRDALPAWTGSGGMPLGLALREKGALARFVDYGLGRLLETMVFLFILVLFLIVLRRRWLALVAVGLFYIALVSRSESSLWPGAVLLALVLAVALTVLTRFGLVALWVAAFANDLLWFTPWTPDPSAWYVWQSVLALAVLVGLAAYGFLAATRGRALFTDLLQEQAA